ncbi:MAG: ATP-binding cassette domain-containing protein [Clostridia bacterium]|nr:ATP-binding cassette domain-containing protein [Clostridia bacterium]
MQIKLQQVEKYFRLNNERIKVVDNVSFSVEQGRCSALLGPSGCGKSTLLAMIAGFFPPDGGKIEVEGRISLCLQRDLLLPWRDLLANVCLPVEARDKSALPAARQEAEQYLPLFGLEGFGGSYPAQLSGGMASRASLLRALMAGGDFWLLDEPFAKLDALTKEDLQLWLRGIIDRFHPGVLLITHDIDEALLLADEICLLSPRPCRLLARLTTPRGRGMEADAQELAALKAEIRRLLGIAA